MRDHSLAYSKSPKRSSPDLPVFDASPVAKFLCCRLYAAGLVLLHFDLGPNCGLVGSSQPDVCCPQDFGKDAIRLRMLLSCSVAKHMTVNCVPSWRLTRPSANDVCTASICCRPSFQALPLLSIVLCMAKLIGSSRERDAIVTGLLYTFAI